MNQASNLFAVVCAEIVQSAANVKLHWHTTASEPKRSAGEARVLARSGPDLSPMTDIALAHDYTPVGNIEVCVPAQG
tara:strand:+ start:420 stop:650 length:231 start_codon:yes stop_codon:yes gene_type:complete